MFSNLLNVQFEVHSLENYTEISMDKGAEMPNKVVKLHLLQNRTIYCMANVTNFFAFHFLGMKLNKSHTQKRKAVKH